MQYFTETGDSYCGLSRKSNPMLEYRKTFYYTIKNIIINPEFADKNIHIWGTEVVFFLLTSFEVEVELQNKWKK